MAISRGEGILSAANSIAGGIKRKQERKDKRLDSGQRFQALMSVLDTDKLSELGISDRELQFFAQTDNPGELLEDAVNFSSNLQRKKNQARLDELRELSGIRSQKRLDLALVQEQRRDRKEARMSRKEDRKQIDEFGTIISNPDEREQVKGLGIDIDSAIENGFVKESTDASGNKVLRILPEKERDRVVSNKTIPSGQLNHLNDTKDTLDTFKEVRDAVNEIVDVDMSAFEIEFEQAENPFFSDLGPFSLPAKFNLVGQFAKDPKYTDAKRKLERAFQKYRKIITGAQASERELRMLRPLITSFQDRPEVFFETLDTLIDETGRQFNNRLDINEARGADVSKFRELVKDKEETETIDLESLSPTDMGELSDEQLMKLLEG